ncbi:MAG TPA: hypothetical protein VG452_11435, partial [Egibacteraceae bacterium]|nr:hypothetical protein [Egibacteraceae bacterium]
MSRSATLVCTALVALALGAGGVAAAGEGTQERGPTVTAAVQVTTNPDPARAHSSPQLAINPTNGELVIVESEVRSDFGCVIHLSADDGRSWFRGGDPAMQPWTECSRKAINGPYATLAFDPGGVLYVAF